MPETSISAPAAKPRGRRGGLVSALVIIVLLGALAAGGWYWWSLQQHATDALDAYRRAAAATNEQLAGLARDNASLRNNADALERKFGDAIAMNKSLREELLGLGERTDLLEDAVSSLADKRMSGAVALKLNEAEFLLRLGQERLVLFGDPANTVAAFRLADAELAEIDDPLFAGVRQTLAAEIAQLAKLPPDDRRATLAQIDAISVALPSFPARRIDTLNTETVPTDGSWSDRAVAVLGDFVRVRKLDAGEAALLNPLQVEAARGALQLELNLAKTALVTGDGVRFRSDLQHARERLAGSFAAGDEQVKRALNALDGLLEQPATPAMPSLGKTIDQLHNLRTTRALTASAPAAPAPAEVEPTPSASPPAPAIEAQPDSR